MISSSPNTPKRAARPTIGLATRRSLVDEDEAPLCGAGASTADNTALEAEAQPTKGETVKRCELILLLAERATDEPAAATEAYPRRQGFAAREEEEEEAAAVTEEDRLETEARPLRSAADAILTSEN
mmetsp:Transcript_21009/g.51429  ORF Transcript_21009/g.51429 Transcript_21009/m.51429 type:complete len:127 (+) Transcript_21009:391-771(+)